MTHEEHCERHKELHRSFDELAADFIIHNHEKRLSNTSLMEFMHWSHQQTIDPVEKKP